MNVIVVCAAWLIGILGGSLFQAPLEILLLAAFLFGGLALVWWPLVIVRMGALFALVMLLGLARSGAHLGASAAVELSPFAGSSAVRVTGMVAGEPEVRDRSTHLVLEMNRILLDEWKPVSGKVLVRVARFPEYSYGDILDLSGGLKQAKVFDDFDYREYLARRGIRWVMDYPQAKKVGSGAGLSALRWIYGAREALTDALNRSLPEPQSSLAAGVFLGIRTNIPDDLLAAFSRTNTYHILAISGMNISLVCGLLGAIGRRLWNRKYNAAFMLAGIIAYAALIGPQPSVVRASIMGGLLVIATVLGRPADTIVWLLVAAVAMTAQDPGLLKDVGFQLSFSATAGLALLAPVFQSRLTALPRWLGESLSVTFAAQVATLPITALNFGQLSLVTPIANLLVVPAVLPLMLGAAATAGLGLLIEPAGQVAGWITWLVASYLILVVEHLGSLSWASISLGKFGVLPVAPYYAVLTLILLGSGNRALGIGRNWLSALPRLPARFTLGALGVMAVVVWAGALTVPSAPTTVSFLDVGQGDAILIHTASGRRVLIDGGPSPTAIANTLGRKLPFWDRALDLVVLTHANQDHIAGLIDVIERHDVKLVLEPAMPSASTSYVRWLEAIRQRNVRAMVASAGQEIALDDDTRLVVLHPSEGSRERNKDDLNENSVVIKLIAGSVSVLLMGDAGREAQREMVASGKDIASTILKVPHHGGPGSLDDSLLAAAQPEVAIISVGTNNRFGHPGVDTLRKLEGVKVYRTDLDGTVEVSIEDPGYWIKVRETNR